MLGNFDQHSTERSSSNSFLSLWDSLFAIPRHVANLFSTPAQSSAEKIAESEEILLTTPPANSDSKSAEETDSDYDSEDDSDDEDFNPDSESSFDSDESNNDSDNDNETDNEADELSDDNGFDLMAYQTWKAKEIKNESTKRLMRETNSSDSECNEKSTKRHCKR